MRKKIIFFRSIQLPPEAKAEGFVGKPVTYRSFGKFTANSGPRHPGLATTPLGAFQCMMNSDVIQLFIHTGKSVAAEKGITIESSAHEVYRYVVATIGHGIVQYAHEQDAYVAEKSDVCGLLGNDLLRSLHTEKRWQDAKQAFSVDRDQLTDHFNKISGEQWIPSQFVELSYFCFPCADIAIFCFIIQISSNRRGWRAFICEYR